MQLAREVTVRRKGRLVLDRVNLSVPAGVTTLIGANGAGKTTLLLALGGRIPIESGEIGLQANRVGYVPQTLRLPSRESALNYLSYFGWLHDLSWRSAQVRAEECLAAVSLLGRGHDPIGRLSGGMQRRVGIAAGLMNQPEVLLLDEALVGLDPALRAEIITLIRSVAAATTVVVTTHHLSDLPALGGAVATMANQRVSEPTTTFPWADESPSVDQLTRWYHEAMHAHAG